MRPQILVENGALVIESATDRNVSFKYGGRSTIMVSDVNLVDVLSYAQAKQEISTYADPASLSILVDDMKSNIIGPSGIESRLRDVENMTRSDRFRRGRLTRLMRRIDNLERRILGIQTKLSENNCNDMPCKNGGTCFDLYDDFFCECQDGWQGKTCEQDFDECAFFAGTELGCQNNARCVNTVGSYNCECTPGWVGLHCTKRKTDCQSSPSTEMCGHGVCLPVSNETGYICLCDQGWQRDNVSNACTVDVNECDGPNPCISRCINLQGSYMCAPCPPGYTGNGWTCTDKDECAINNGGCSLAPRVRCYNTVGSYRCGSCPPGYVGDGKTCTAVNVNTCNRNNVCHPRATCQPSPFSCICPRGMVGDGIGPNGCRENANSCEDNPCLNGGTCVTNGTTYSCICPPGLLQPTCRKPYDPCNPDPCENGGTCTFELAENSRRFTCQCPPGFFGRRCGYDSSMCTGLIAEQRGYIHFPGNNNTYEHNDRCVWVLKTTWGKVLNVTFTSFNLEYSKDCVHDWLQIHDGRGSSAPPLGRFCGTDKPRGGNIVSSQNYLYLWFRSDNSSSHDGFEFNWNTIDPVCGGQFNAEKPGVISSPAYPGKTPSGSRCDWNIQATVGKRVQLTFYSFEANGRDYNCSHEYLAVYDGETTRGPLLGLFCDSVVPDPIQSSSHQVMVSLQTDMTKPDAAFQLHYAAVPGIPGCGGVFTAYSGTFGSPIVNGYYPSNVICEYIIQLPPTSTISLEFTKFKLEDTTACRDDYVEIYEGSTEEDGLVGRWCGENNPGNYTSLSNTLLIKFRSDFLINAEGFTIRYKVGCVSHFMNSTGSVRSPNYPQSYFPNFECVYKIEAPPGYVINMTSQDFALEIAYPACDYDYVEIFDGHRHPDSSLGRFCSNKAPSQIISSSSYMEILFHTDSTNQFRGFYLQYNFVNVGCGGVIKDLNGTLTSPNANEVSQTGLNGTCIWILDLPPKYSTYLKFSTFNVACGTNYLEISYDRTSRRQTQRYCGVELPPTNLYSGRVKITYKSQFGFSSDGFEATYEGMDTENQCGGNFSAPAGNLQSPGYPNKYPPMKKCEWIIVAPLGHQIELNVNKFHLENDCKFDYLEIRDGRTEESPIIGKYCDDKIPPLISSFTNAMHIKFESDISREYEGFDIEWQQTATGCGGKLESYRGSFVSPHFPDFLDEVMQCDWKISINQGSSLLITVKYFDSEADSLECAKRNYISIYDGDSAKDKKFKRNCTAGISENTFITTKNTAFARFVSNSTLTGMFRLNYTVNCNNVLRNPYGVIESPNYPNNYPDNISCQWRIIAKRGTKISVAFSHFDLEESFDDSCSRDRLEVIEIKDNVNVRSQKYCQTKPEDFVSEVDEVVIKFVTDFSVTMTGFRVEYRIQGCDETLTGTRGRISSPGHPQPTSNKDCEYFIEVDYGYLVMITINDAVFPMRASDCSANGLVIADGYNTSNILTRICEPAIPGPTYIGTSNKMYLHFRADATNTGKRFSANFASQPGCGGNMKSMEGYVYSPNYPEKYDLNTTCMWQIEVQRYHTIDLSFIDAELGNSSSCSDYLEIFNGNNPTEANLLYKYCGGTQYRTDVMQTDQRTAIIRFRSSGKSQAKGFKIYYKQNCGYSGPVLDEGTLAKNSNMGNCIWTLKTDPAKRFRISFTALQCGCSIKTNRTSCDNDEGIFVYDGDSTNAPLKLSFCKRMPLPVISSGPSITIKATKGAFDLLYSTYIEKCGGVLSALHGSLATPNYPNSYPKQVECIWTVSAPSGNSIQLHFEDFEVISLFKSCDQDYLEIREKGVHGPLLGIFCGNELPPNVVAYETMWIKFRSTDETVGKGFYAEYSNAHDNTITGNDGVIQSPRWDYMHNEDIDYTWRVYVNMSNVIMLNIRHFSDGLKIYNGYDDTAPEMEVDMTTESIMSATRTIFLKADHNTPDVFEIAWQAVPRNTTEENILKQCGHKIVSVDSNVNFTSPGYPENYANHLDCEWVIKSTDPARHVVINFRNIDMEASTDCFADYISLSQSSDMQNWVNELKVCSMEAMDAYVGTPYLRVKFVTDSSVNDKGFLAQIGTNCGSNLTDLSGVIDYDEYAHPRRNCTWRIRVNSGRKIKFQFLRKRNETVSPDTCTNYLSIRDGFDNTAPFLGNGKYCTNHTDDIPPTTSSRAFVRFVVSDYARNMKWTLLYHEVRDYCGESVQLNRFLPEATIITPSFPNLPKPYSECTWTVMAPVGESINITFVEFHMRPSHDCEDEYLQIFDGATAIAPELIKSCWVSRPEGVRTSQNAAYLKYLSEIPIPSNGFKLIVSIAKCGAKFVSNVGTITSKNYPALGSYPGRSVCEYQIAANRGYINVTFVDIDLPMAQNASQSDHLIFYYFAEQPNNSTQQKEALRLYGNNTLSSMVFMGSNLVIKFFSFDNNAGHRGFKISYIGTHVPCNEEIRGESGEISTPFYPNRPHLPLTCSWRIMVPAGRRVKLEFLDYRRRILDTPMQFNASNNAVLTFYNDYSLVSEIPASSGQTIYSSSRFMAIKLAFQTQSDFISAKMRFTSNELTVCTGDVTATSGQIVPPPGNVATYYCDYLFEVNPNETLVLTLKDVNFNATGNSRAFCSRYAAIKIVDRVSPDMFICSNVTKKIHVTTATKVNLKIVASSYYSGLSYVIEYRRHACGGLAADVGQLNSIEKPFFAENYVSGPVDCVWIFPRKLGSEMIAITVTINSPVSCANEYVKIHAGLGRGAETTFCGNVMANNSIVIPFGHIHYHADSYSSNSNFNVNARLARMCGSVNHNSPNDLSLSKAEYINNANCTWYVITDDSKSLLVKLEFVGRFFIEASSNCTKDYLEIRNEDNPGTDLIAKVCGREIPEPIYTRGRTIVLTFRSDNDTVGEGFTIRVSRICTSSYNATAQWQNVSKPFLLHNPPMRCTYEIFAPANRWIQIQFNSMLLDTTSNCERENISATINRPQGEDDIPGFCTLDEGREFESLEKATIIYQNAMFRSRTHFSFGFRMIDCGGIINSSTVISSPKIRDEYLDNTYCQWNVTTSPDKVIRVTFEKFHLEHSLDCNLDYVRIFAGNEISDSNRKANLCGDLSKRLPTIFINSNQALIEAGTDASITGDGFIAVVKLTQKCDVDVTLNSSIDSYNLTRFSGSYENELDCRYTFTTNLDHQLEIDFSQFDLKPCNETTPACLCDYVQLSDTAIESGGHKGQFCGNQFPPRFSTFTNKLFLRFVSDASGTGTGFRATITKKRSVCGQSLYTISRNAPITIEFPPNNNAYQPLAKCFWQLTGTEPFDIHFENFDLLPPSSDGSCLDYLEMTINAKSEQELDMEGHRVSRMFDWEAQRGTFKYCGNSTPSDFLPDILRATLKFSSNSYSSDARFKFTAKTIEGCSKNMTHLYGKIVIKGEQLCTVTIAVPENYTISLHIINAFNRRLGGCDNPNITKIYDQNTNALLNSLCNIRRESSHLFYNTNRIRIESPFRYRRYFDIAYIANSPEQGIGCGGDVYGPIGVISSPLYPSSVRNNTLCRWNIRAPEKAELRFSFLELDLGSSTLCDTDYLEIVEFTGLFQNVTRKICGEDKVERFIVRRNTVSIIYKKTVNFDGTGWILGYDIGQFL